MPPIITPNNTSSKLITMPAPATATASPRVLWPLHNSMILTPRPTQSTPSFDDISCEIRGSHVEPERCRNEAPTGPQQTFGVHIGADALELGSHSRRSVEPLPHAEKVSTASASWVAYIFRWALSSAAIRGVTALPHHCNQK